MQDTVRCPSCKAVLVVPPAPPSGDFSCPRCQSLVPLPHPAESEASIAVTTSPLRPPGPTSIQPEPSDDMEVSPKFRPRVSTMVLMSLIGCCVLGIAAVVLTAGRTRDRYRNLLGLFVVLDILVVVRLAIWMFGSPERPFVLSFSKRTTATVLVFLLLAVAAVIFFFSTCVVLLRV